MVITPSLLRGIHSFYTVKCQMIFTISGGWFKEEPNLVRTETVEPNKTWCRCGCEEVLPETLNLREVCDLNFF